ncbi:hypothetical protein MGYG_07707 [Nannizzia gypsea CBS 118893]|uniref:Uncharacterized protein n=1 Tax=Arthroderma gypseum (strain ATCC MYA-4604 / CBS 118893) TaxID=535722 RepID=E4V3X5_ARTGP|nr:hypothetical protein MGYG_07707 [Nannizzia gypsea CBS 118893]EFR04699.1 hypothetical protein MGYG_07707 [Nannizzia gypsea CBS 118893]
MSFRVAGAVLASWSGVIVFLSKEEAEEAYPSTATLHTRSRSPIPAQLRPFTAIDQVTSWFSHDRPLSGHSGPSPDGSRLPEYRLLEHGSEFLEEAMPTTLTVLMRPEAICHELLYIHCRGYSGRLTDSIPPFVEFRLLGSVAFTLPAAYYLYQSGPAGKSGHDAHAHVEHAVEKVKEVVSEPVKEETKPEPAAEPKAEPEETKAEEPKTEEKPKAEEEPKAEEAPKAESEAEEKPKEEEKAAEAPAEKTEEEKPKEEKKEEPAATEEKTPNPKAPSKEPATKSS